MALTKKMLQAMEISEDKIDQIIEAHRDTINGLTAERDTLKADLEKAQAESQRLSNVEKELVKAQAKAEEADVTANRLKTLQDEYDKYKADMKAKTEHDAKEKAYKALLTKAGIPEKRHDAILKVSDLSDFEIDGDGNVKDEKTVLDGINSEWADFKVTETKQGADVSNPPENNGGTTFEKMSLGEKMAYANENPNDAEVKAWLK